MGHRPEQSFQRLQDPLRTYVHTGTGRLVEVRKSLFSSPLPLSIVGERFMNKYARERENLD